MAPPLVANHRSNYGGIALTNGVHLPQDNGPTPLMGIPTQLPSPFA